MRSPGRHPEVISVAELLRREGMRAPHSAPGPLRLRGPAPSPFPDPVEPSGFSRRVVAAGSILVVGTMLGSVALNDGIFAPGHDADADAEAALGPGALPASRARAGRPSTSPPRSSTCPASWGAAGRGSTRSVVPSRSAASVRAP